MLLATLMSFSFEVSKWLAFLFIVKGEVDMDRAPRFYFLYTGLTIVPTFFLTFANFQFLCFCMIGYSRRTCLLNELTNALVLDFEAKDAASIRYPTINFCDAQSLATWIEARRLALALGQRYALRVHCLTVSFLVLSIVFLSGFIIWIAGYLPEGLLNVPHVIQLCLYTICFNWLTLKALLACSQQNVQTNKQIKLLIHIRDQIKRITVEQCYLEMNPSKVSVRIHQLIL